MAIVRCEKHPVDITRATNNYVTRVEPVGYPNTAAICGSLQCKNHGLVWFTKDELDEFNKGERYFNVKTNTLKLKVSDKLLPFS